MVWYRTCTYDTARIHYPNSICSLPHKLEVLYMALTRPLKSAYLYLDRSSHFLNGVNNGVGKTVKTSKAWNRVFLYMHTMKDYMYA